MRTLESVRSAPVSTGNVAATRAERSSSTSVCEGADPQASRPVRANASHHAVQATKADQAGGLKQPRLHHQHQRGSSGKDADAGVLGIEQRDRFLERPRLHQIKTLHAGRAAPSRSISLSQVGAEFLRDARARRPEDGLPQPAKLARQANVCRIADGRAVLTGVGQIQARRGHHVSGEPNRVARDSGLDGAGRIHTNDIDDDLEAQRQEGHLAREDGRGDLSEPRS